MRPKIVNRVVETTVSTGTGTIELDGAQTGYRAYSDELNSGDVTIYLIADSVSSSTVYEMGLGTVTIGATTTLSRDQVIDSSNSGNKISLTTGTHIVTGTVSAELLNILADVIDSDHDLAGSSGAYTLTTLSGVTAYEGMMIGATANHDNPVGVATLNRNAAGADNIVLPDGSAPHAGALESGRFYLFRFKAANKWVVLNPTVISTNLHASGSVSAATSLDITDLPANASEVTVKLRKIVGSSSAATLSCRTSTNNGSTWDSGASDYSHTRPETVFNSTAGAGLNADTKIDIAAGWGTAGGDEGAFEVVLDDPGGTGSTFLRFNGSFEGSSGNFTSINGHGRRLLFADVDAIQFFFSAGTITCDYEVWVTSA